MLNQGWRSQNASRVAEPAPAPRPYPQAPLRRHEVRVGGGSATHWLDSMLGQGSRRALGEALGPFERAAAKAVATAVVASRKLDAPRTIQRMEAVGAEPKPGRRKKGLIRLVLAGSAALWALAQFRPWDALGGLSPVKEVKPAAEARVHKEEDRKALLEASGKALALWQGRDGAWFEVNRRGELRAVESQAALKRLDLPRLAGARLLSEEKRGGRMLRLEVRDGLLEELLPLEHSLAPEIEAVWIEGGHVRLRTHAGVWALLGDADYAARQARLSAVLSDLAARRKRAESVDMRFQGSAVVRLASR